MRRSGAVVKPFLFNWQPRRKMLLNMMGGLNLCGNQNCFVARILVQGTDDQLFQLAVGVLCIHTFAWFPKITMGAAGTALNGKYQSKKPACGK